MNKVQKFVLENIYCAPGQDRQFSFSLIRVNSVNKPFTSFFSVYNVVKNLPSTQYKYHIFVIGNINPIILNLLRQSRDWFRDVWIRVSTDMVTRNYIMHIYNERGVIYPRQHVYYSFIDENSVVVALEFDHMLKQYYDVNSFRYMHIYSNIWYNSSEFNLAQTQSGIKYGFSFVYNNLDKLNLQNEIQSYEQNGGKAIVYVNGYYTDNLNLNIPDNSYIEYVYDQSIISKEKFKIGDLRTFQSEKDNKNKYLIFRDNIIDGIQFKDDTEIYISNDNELVTKGLFFYQHKDYAVRNVTDKDFSLYTNFVNNAAQEVSNLTSGSIQDKIIVLYTRKANETKKLVYSASKMHELYKLPQNVEIDVLASNYTGVVDFRAETLENSDYFRVTGLKNIKDLSIDLAVNTLGYGAIAYYFAKTPVAAQDGNTYVNVPILYQEESLAFEYNENGEFIGWYTTSGPIYIFNNSSTKQVEFIYGRVPQDFGRLLEHNETATLVHNEYRVLSAYFIGVNRISDWEDITYDTNRCSVSGNQLTITESTGYRAKVLYFNQPNVYDLNLELVDGTLYFPITVVEDRGTGLQTFPMDVPPLSLEVYLNKRKLAYGLDYFVDFPYISICNKEYINLSSIEQNIHIRAYGFTLDKTKINAHEKVGFVNHGVLLRNNYYDIRDDRLISIYIKGLMQRRENIIFAEEDNTVRMSNPINGFPYIVKEPFIPLKSISTKDTIDLFEQDIEKNKRISGLFNLIFPEPPIDQTNVIPDHYYIFSPLVSKIILDMLDGNIPSSLYTNPYNDETIISLLDEDPYKKLLALDPVKHNMPDNLVEIHPHYGNAVINVNLFQYRFISNIIRIITNNNPNKINLSGYLSVTV